MERLIGGVWPSRGQIEEACRQKAYQAGYCHVQLYRKPAGGVPEFGTDVRPIA